MPVQVPKDVEKDVKKASEELNVSEEELVDRALHFYLSSVEKLRSLSREFAAWDKMSDEALHDFEDAL